MYPFRNFAIEEKTFKRYGVFKSIHVPLLVFQYNAFNKLRSRYGVTRLDFLVLSAGHLIESNSLIKCFDLARLKGAITGISQTLLFKSLNKLREQGYIELKEQKKSKRRYYITEKGFGCIAAFTELFNHAVCKYKFYTVPECFRVSDD